MKPQHALICALLTLGLGLTACEKKADTPMEKLEENVKDGLDARPNEKLKDAGEDAADAIEQAGEAVQEAVTPDPK